MSTLNMNGESGNVVNIDSHQRWRPPVVHGSAVPVDDVVEVDQVADVEPLAEPVPAPRPTVAEPVVDRSSRARVIIGRVVEQSRRPRPRRVLTDAELIRRDTYRAVRRARARTTGRVLLGTTIRTGRGAGMIVAAVARGTGRWLWLPEDAADIRALREDDRKEALKRRGDLRRTRGVRGAVVCASAAAAYWTAPLVDLDVPWWGWGIGGAAAALGAWAAGRPVVELLDAGEADMPRGLTLGLSDQGVRRTLVEALGELKGVKGRVLGVQRAPAGWGWTVTLEVIGELDAVKLGQLLDTPRGGVMISEPRESSRARVVRLVMLDLLGAAEPAEPVTLDALTSPARLARRYDGGWLEAVLAAVHVLLIGRTGSGKSTALHRLLDVFTEARAVVGGIDPTDGPDLRAWRLLLDPRLSAFGDDPVAIGTALANACAIAADRKRRIADGEAWRSTRADPPIRIVIDEYGEVAANAELRRYVEWLTFYGRGVDVTVVLANHRAVADMMGTSRVASQVQIKVYLAMSAEDVRSLPKSVRDQGVAPDLLQPAHLDVANDAGKAYVLGVDQVPPLVRFGVYGSGEAARRAAERAALGDRGELSTADVAAITASERVYDGVPAILCDLRTAIMAAAGDGRDPVRATTAECVDYLRHHGHDVAVATLTPKVREAAGNAYPERRKVDTNLPGGNLKGWYLDDVDDMLARWRELNPRAE